MKRINVIILGLAIVFGLFAFIKIQQPSGAVVGTNVGNIAPDLKLNNPAGTQLDLYSNRGYYVLVDFWASWCGPCRGENPNVVATYNKFHEAKFKGAKGFKIFSVSLDQNASAWTGAIKSDGLVWPDHVSDLKGWSSAAARLYGVNSIPTNFLIDPKGVIIAEGLRGAALGDKLNELSK
jgi:thiol-disulfide isomerase/thioredoxin